MIFCKQSCICLTNLHRQTDSQKTNQLQNKQVLQYYAQDCKSGWEEHKNLGSVPGLPVCLFILLKNQKQPHVSTNEWSQMCSLVLSLTTHPFRNLTVDLLTLPPFFLFLFFFLCTWSSWPVNLLYFLLRNGVQLCAMGTIVEGQFTTHLTELELPILTQISHSSSILALRKVCILQGKLTYCLRSHSLCHWDWNKGLEQGFHKILNAVSNTEVVTSPRYLWWLNQEACRHLP